MKDMKNILILAALMLLPAGTFAQTDRKPSEPIRPYVVRTRQALGDLERSLRSDNKVVDLIGGQGMELRVAVQHDKLRENADAEVHDASDDVYYVLEGEAMLTLGGKLAEPKESAPGEWKGRTIAGGQTMTIRKGDLVVVPRGTPHQRNSVKGKEFSMILIKVFETPLPAGK